VKALALYTTVYPGVEKYLNEWYRSVKAQTDQDYQLWIGLDTMGVESAKEAMGNQVKANWVEASSGDTPAQVRDRALSQIVDICDGVVMVDSDDILHTTRIASARAALQTSDLAGCALRLVDERGKDLKMTFSLPPKAKPENVLPRNNVFGLSNSAFRSVLLRRSLPIPSDVALVDWFLATKAWLYGARLAFDPVARMDYRQHSANMTCVRPPFSTQQVIKDTERVRHHFEIVLADPRGDYRDDRLAEVKRVASDVESFFRKVVLKETQLDRYVQALNALKLKPLWWSSVAYPSLQHMWEQ
jgi:hypothetical protein